MKELREALEELRKLIDQQDIQTFTEKSNEISKKFCGLEPMHQENFLKSITTEAPQSYTLSTVLAIALIDCVTPETLDRCLDLLFDRMYIQKEQMAEIAKYLTGKEDSRLSNEAYENNLLEILRYLIDKNKIDVSQHDWNSQLTRVCQYGRLEILRYLVDEKGIDINLYSGACGETLLILACWHNQFKIVEYLVTEKKVDINRASQSQCGRHTTALIMARRFICFKTVKFLVENGASDLPQTKERPHQESLPLSAHKLSFQSFISSMLLGGIIVIPLFYYGLKHDWFSGIIKASKEANLINRFYIPQSIKSILVSSNNIAL